MREWAYSYTLNSAVDGGKWSASLSGKLWFESNLNLRGM
jgi:hypothetical protein